MVSKESQSPSSTTMAPVTYVTDINIDYDGGTAIRTTITNSGETVKLFLKEVRRNQQNLIVGVDTEWRVISKPPPDGHRSTYRTAVLQLCVGRRCLVLQIVHADYVPLDALPDFLASPHCRFAGVGVDNDVKRLSENYGIEIANAVDLRRVVADVLAWPELRQAGLKALTHKVMGVVIVKPKRVGMSEWDACPLSPEQVEYACIDAFVSYKVSRLLLSGQCRKGPEDEGTIAYVGIMDGSVLMQKYESSHQHKPPADEGRKS